MELLAPAGNVEKLATAYRYGADAAYIGVQGFSLRTHADTVASTELAGQLRDLKVQGKRLYAALNLFAHQQDLDRLPEALEVLRELPIDAVILADIGLIDPVTTALPDVELHLSTQANCTNGAAAKLYHRLGFSRIVPARELSLDEVKAMKDAVPGLEVEVFVHGAMCMAYSGRCFLSDFLTGRSANRGDCAQSCRWKYSVEHYRLEEEQRPGEYIPVESDGRFISILSSRDLMLFDHMEALIDAGVDAAKIEGRMKSSLYAAAVTRSYRAAIDAVHAARGGAGLARVSAAARDAQPINLAAHRQELFRISHREYTTGFLLGDETVHNPALDSEGPDYRLMGILGNSAAGGWTVTVKNTIHRGQEIQYLPASTEGPTQIHDREFDLRDSDGSPVDRITNAGHGIIVPSPDAREHLTAGTVIRAPRNS